MPTPSGRLAATIDSHEMNEAPDIEGLSTDKRGYIQRLLQDAETERALLDQREVVVSYMAKLVALDAMALADAVAEKDARRSGGQEAERRDLTLAVDAFVD